MMKQAMLTRVLIVRKSPVEAYGKPYFAPIKPVLHKKTKIKGMAFLSINEMDNLDKISNRYWVLLKA